LGKKNRGPGVRNSTAEILESKGIEKKKRKRIGVGWGSKKTRGAHKKKTERRGEGA